MSSFPFYDMLSNNIKNKDLTIKQKNEFMTKISHIDEKGTELLYLIIRLYEINNNKDVIESYKLPYSGNYINKTDIQFDLEQFPVILKQMLYKFINIHIKQMEEENTIVNERPVI
jgi:hypothetical protein